MWNRDTAGRSARAVRSLEHDGGPSRRLFVRRRVGLMSPYHSGGEATSLRVCLRACGWMGAWVMKVTHYNTPCFMWGRNVRPPFNSKCRSACHAHERPGQIGKLEPITPSVAAVVPIACASLTIRAEVCGTVSTSTTATVTKLRCHQRPPPRHDTTPTPSICSCATPVPYPWDLTKTGQQTSQNPPGLQSSTRPSRDLRS